MEAGSRLCCLVRMYAICVRMLVLVLMFVFVTVLVAVLVAVFMRQICWPRILVIGIATAFTDYAGWLVQAILSTKFVTFRRALVSIYWAGVVDLCLTVSGTRLYRNSLVNTTGVSEAKP